MEHGDLVLELFGSVVEGRVCLGEIGVVGSDILQHHLLIGEGIGKCIEISVEAVGRGLGWVRVAKGYPVTSGGVMLLFGCVAAPKIFTCTFARQFMALSHNVGLSVVIIPRHPRHLRVI